jgi:hypothetical protein
MPTLHRLIAQHATIETRARACRRTRIRVERDGARLRHRAAAAHRGLVRSRLGNRELAASALPLPGRLLRDEPRAHPYRALAIAGGIGRVLGTRRGASLILPLAARLAASLAATAMAPLLARSRGAQRTVME